MRRTAKMMAAAAIAVAALSGHARAQDHETARTATSGSAANNVTTYEFPDGSDVQATPLGPEGSGISVVRRTRRDTLVHPRMHFMDKLLTSVETL